MNLESLYNFIVLVDLMNFTKTAEYLHMSQSTLSKQIAALEQSLGVQLLIRTNRSLSVTPAGRHLYGQGKKLLTQVEDLKEQLVSLERDHRGTLTVSSITVDSPPLFAAFDYFRKAYPNAELQIRHALLSEALKNVYSGKADVGITANYVLSPEEHGLYRYDLDVLRLKREPLYLLISEQLAGLYENPVSLRSLAPGTKVLVENRLLQYLRNLPEVPALLSHLDIDSMGADYKDWVNMLFHVKSGLSVSLVPRPLSHDGCVMLQVKDDALFYDILAVWEQSPSNEFTQLFIELLRQTLELEQEYGSVVG